LQELEEIDKSRIYYDFLDGDFIETLLEMKENDQVNIVNHAISNLKQQGNGGSLNSLGLKEIRMLIENLR
jgi:hypothetical protein